MRRLFFTMLLLPFTVISVNAQVRPEVHRIVDSIVRNNIRGEALHEFEPSDSPYWRRYQDLNKMATDEELVYLTFHPDEAVKSYAFLALTGRRHKAVPLIFLHHLTDSAEVEMAPMGCMVRYIPVYEVLRDIAFSTEPHRNFELPVVYRNRIRLLPARLSVSDTSLTIQVTVDQQTATFNRTVDGQLFPADNTTAHLNGALLRALINAIRNPTISEYAYRR